MCNCIKEVSELTEQQLKESCEKEGHTLLRINSGFHGDGLENTVFTLSKDNNVTGLRLKTNFIARYTFKKKDGSDSRPKALHVPLLFTFCPFCGERYEKEEEKVEMS